MAKDMDIPFVFGVRVEGDAFTDRREETERLKANVTYGVNTILISPRRMGKTSLVDKVCSLVESDVERLGGGHRTEAYGNERPDIGFMVEKESLEGLMKGRA